MKKVLYLLLTIIVTISVCAEPITRQQARQQAEIFLQEKGTLIVRDAAFTIGRKTPAFMQPLYVFNVANDGGFVIVAGDDRVDPIIGYATHGRFDEEDIPENFRAWLEQTAKEIESIENNFSAASTESITKISETVSVHSKISPLIITAWNQGNTDNVYNAHLPLVNGQRPCAGCVPTAGAQLMYYYHKDLPKMTEPVPGYRLIDYEGNDYSHGANTSNDLPAIEFLWDKMKMRYSMDDPDAEAVSAVADLMLYCGYAAHVNYDTSENGGSSANTSTLARGMSAYFGFNPDSWKSVTRSHYSIREWDELIYNELANGRPIIYSGSYQNSGHAFICDGYDGEGMYHFNWGWGGSFNGYFKLQATNPYGESNIHRMGYIDNNDCIIGLQPNSWPEITYSDTEDIWEIPEINGIVATASNVTVDNKTVTMRLSNANEETYAFGFGIGELNADGTITPIDTSKEYYKRTALEKGYYFPSVSFNFSSYNLSDGVHKLVPISLVSGESEWKRCKPGDLFIEVEVVNGKKTSIIAHPIENLEINEFDLANDGTPGYSQGVNLNITNSGDNLEKTLYLYVGTASNRGNWAGRQNIKIAAGNTKRYKINIGKLDAGHHTLRLLNSYNGDIVLAEKNITITNDLKATNFEFPDLRFAESDVKVVATVENHAGDYMAPLYLFADNGGLKKMVYAAGSAIEKGSSEDVTFYFHPDRTGTWNLYITTDQEGDNVIGQTTLDITEADAGEVKLELVGSSVTCIDNGTICTLSLRNTGNTANYREIHSWLYFDNDYSSSIDYKKSQRVTILPGETKNVTVTFEGLDAGKNYQANFYYMRDFFSSNYFRLGTVNFTFYFDDIHHPIDNMQQATVLNSTVYNLNGQRLTALRKGINIISGKKIIIK